MPLSWIGVLRDACPKVGDVFFDIDGKQYVVHNEFILAHPNDEGMRTIANSIFNAITLLDL